MNVVVPYLTQWDRQCIQRRSQEFDLGGYKCQLVFARRQNNHTKKIKVD